MKNLLMFAMLVVSFSAMADPVQKYSAIAIPTPTFKYEEATAHNPILVNASVPTGECRFKIALWGIQRGAGVPVSDMVGRIESGDCDGKPVTQGIVRAYVEYSGAMATLGSHVDVVVFK